MLAGEWSEPKSKERDQFSEAARCGFGILCVREMIFCQVGRAGLAGSFRNIQALVEKELLVIFLKGRTDYELLASALSLWRAADGG